MSWVKDYTKCTDEELLEDDLARCKYCKSVTVDLKGKTCTTCKEIISHARYNLDVCQLIINDLRK